MSPFSVRFLLQLFTTNRQIRRMHVKLFAILNNKHDLYEMSTLYQCAFGGFQIDYVIIILYLIVKLIYLQ